MATDDTITRHRDAEAADDAPSATRLSRSGEQDAPLWSQVKASLVAMIVGGNLPEHTRLPSESEFCEQFGVSRTVVREAMKQLVFERMIYKLQGKGAFVAGRREDQDFVGSTIGFSGELAEKQKSVTRQVLRQALEPADARVQKLLQLPDERLLVAVDRILSVDGVPRMLVRWRMPETLVPGLDQAALHSRSLYDTLSRQYGIVFSRAERWIEAVVPTDAEAKLLGVAPRTPLLGIESVAYTAAGTPIEYWTALYRTDRARLHLQIGTSR
ncbi:GntR family transcriptional regulator [Methylobrevis albus]|uniref:GntR family transcriptional regulator n=1 Tax=Methylobrevis albus TaxID=2793297 RepID=A0A931I3C3_9HYPH|nr:GntR family transcriptional regulator [Methylobrevis albus]MBH0239492.1 GntR family transcriptional regulator [Methylobrevis albus]